MDIYYPLSDNLLSAYFFGVYEIQHQVVNYAFQVFNLIQTNNKKQRNCCCKFTVFKKYWL